MEVLHTSTNLYGKDQTLIVNTQIYATYSFTQAGTAKLTHKREVPRLFPTETLMLHNTAIHMPQYISAVILGHIYAEIQNILKGSVAVYRECVCE